MVFLTCKRCGRYTDQFYANNLSTCKECLREKKRQSNHKYNEARKKLRQEESLALREAVRRLTPRDIHQQIPTGGITRTELAKRLGLVRSYGLERLLIRMENAGLFIYEDEDGRLYRFSHSHEWEDTYASYA